MTQLIDRRQNSGKKSTVNRQRFLRRYKKQIQRAVSDAINSRSITEIDRGEEIVIPAKDISEPRFSYGQGGIVERVLPGNDQFNKDDRIKRPPKSKDNAPGSNASNEGEGEDNFAFQLSREEFLDIYFDGLELPSLVRKELANINTLKPIHGGIAKVGSPSNINVVRSMRQATSRRIALGSKHKKALKSAEQKLIKLKAQKKHNEQEFLDLSEEIKRLKKRIFALPFIDTIDLRYNNVVRVPYPSTQAVMFCIMDVSGSMDEPKKDIAKRFFILLYLFLTKAYEKIKIVFIRHHTSAKEVNEHDFFYSRETGGTVVSSALELLHELITTKYNPAAWNIYVAQASDGDNWNADSPLCLDILEKQIMPLVQYYSYIEIMPRHHQSLWEVYLNLKEKFPNFAMENIDNQTDIYPVFRELFKRQNS